MSTERVISSISRLVEVLADKSSIDGMADSVFPMNSAAFGRERMKNKRFKDNPTSEIEKFPYVGILKMDRQWYSLLEVLSEVKCENWKIYYGHSDTSILVDESESTKFFCFDPCYLTGHFFMFSDEIEVKEIQFAHNCFVIHANNTIKGSINFRYRARDLRKMHTENPTNLIKKSTSP